MYQGQIVEQGEVKQFFKVSSIYTKALIASRPSLEE
jgi:ABC-type dipeptide/oligopeptide/nickel transport system ATPase component